MADGQNRERLEYLDGLRGIAAVIVLLHHMVLSFYPQLADGSQHYFHGNWPLAPVMLAWGGNLCVCIFFLLSGFVLVPATLHAKSYLLTQFTRRLIRLVPPVLAASLIGYALWSLGLMRNTQATTVGASGWIAAFFQGQPSLVEVFRDAICMPFVPVESRYDPVLWTMHVEYVGSFGIIAAYVLLHHKLVRTVVLLAALALTYGTYYSDFIVGALLADYNLRERGMAVPVILRRGLIAVFSVLFLLFGAYSWAAGPGSPWNWADAFIEHFITDYTQAHMLAAMFLLPVLLWCRPLQILLSRKIPLALGRQSFSIYLIHLPLIGSLVCAIFLHAEPRFGYAPSFWLCAAILLAVTYAIALLFTRFIDAPTTNFSRRAGKAMDAYFARNLERRFSVVKRWLPHVPPGPGN
jgi:peptidoglycan/LPS O-acetylase OafA/YrhL